MVKSVLSVYRQGLRDWLFQRVSAVVMAVFFLGLIAFFAIHTNLAYYEWHGLFAQNWVKVVTMLFTLSLLYHTWIGMWTVYTDYIKPTCIRFIIEIITLLALISFFFAMLLILWSV